MAPRLPPLMADQVGAGCGAQPGATESGVLAPLPVCLAPPRSQEGQEAWLLLPASGADEYGLSAIQFYVAKKLMAKVRRGRGRGG